MRWSDQEVSRPKPSVWRFSTKSCSVDEEHERESMLVFWRRFDGTTVTSGESLWRRRSRCCSCRGELGSGLLRMELEALVELAMEKEKTAAVAKSLRFAIIMILSVRWARGLYLGLDGGLGVFRTSHGCFCFFSPEKADQNPTEPSVGPFIGFEFG